MALSKKEMLRKCLERIGARGTVLAREFLRSLDGSHTLQREMGFAVDGVNDHEAVGRVTVPFHWALYVHDGRRRVVAPAGHYLCFFPNKRDDPRTSGGTDYPATPAIQRAAHKLNAEEFYFYLEENRLRQEAGQEPVMIVTRTVGPVTKKIQFFDVGLRPLQRETSLIVPGQFRLFLAERGHVRDGNLSRAGTKFTFGASIG